MKLNHIMNEYKIIEEKINFKTPTTLMFRNKLWNINKKIQKVYFTSMISNDEFLDILQDLEELNEEIDEYILSA